MLYYWLAKSIEIIQPKVFIAENVKGLLSIPGAVARIKKDFESLGYIVQVKLLSAPDYGVPQTRERVIFIGVRKKSVKNKKVLQQLINESLILHPTPTHGNGLLPLVSSKKALHGLKEPHQSLDPSQQQFSKAKWLPKGQGQKEINLEGLSPTIRAEHHGNIEFRRLNKIHGGGHHHELNKGLKERRLTVRECARIQTFPDDYEFVSPNLSANSSYKIIGNAVPPLLGNAIALHLEKLWSKLFK